MMIKKISAGFVVISFFVLLCGFSLPNVNEAPCKIAFVNMDSIYAKSIYAKMLRDSVVLENDKVMKTLNDMYLNLEQHKAEFENARNNQIFVSVDETEKERIFLEEHEQRVDEAHDRSTQYLQGYEERIFNRINATINEQIDEYTTDKNFDYIFINSNLGWDVYANERCNVTNDFVYFMNKRYEALLKIDVINSKINIREQE